MIYKIKIKSKKTFYKKLLILILFCLCCFFIKSCSVKAVSLDQVPSFLNGYYDYPVRCQDNDSSICDYLNMQPSDFDNSIVNIYLTGFIENKVMFQNYVLKLTHPDNNNQTDEPAILIFSSQPLSIRCDSSVYGCQFGYYKNGTFKPATGSYEYYLFENRNTQERWFSINSTPSQIGRQMIIGHQTDNIWYDLHNIPITDYLQNGRIEANYDVFYVNNNTTYYQSYSYLDWSNFDNYDQIDTRNIFERIIDAIISIPDTIISWVRNIINSIGNAFSGLFNFIHDFFIPDADLFNSFIVEEYDYLQSRLGFMMYPITLITDFFNRFNSIPNSANATFTIPDVSFMEHTLIHQSSINLNDIVNSNTIFQYIYNIYQVAVSGLIVIWVAKLGYKKFNETYGGGYK